MTIPVNGNGFKSSMTLFSQFIMVTLVIVGGLWSLAISPIKTDLSRFAVLAEDAHLVATSNRSDIETIKAQNATSIKDRDELNKAKAIFQEQIAELQKSFAKAEERHLNKEIEIETQFSASDQLRNGQYSELQRTLAIIWNHVDGLGNYPTAPFFQPSISQHQRPEAQ